MGTAALHDSATAETSTQNVGNIIRRDGIADEELELPCCSAVMHKLYGHTRETQVSNKKKQPLPEVSRPLWEIKTEEHLKRLPGSHTLLSSVCLQPELLKERDHNHRAHMIQAPAANAPV